MLIDKGISANEVVTIKLASGEEVITKLVEETDTAYKVSKPMVLSVSQQGVGLMPFLFTVNPSKDIKLNKSTITVIEVTDPDFAKQYSEQTSGIKLA